MAVNCCNEGKMAEMALGWLRTQFWINFWMFVLACCGGHDLPLEATWRSASADICGKQKMAARASGQMADGIADVDLIN